MFSEEHLIASGIFLSIGVLMSWWTYYKKIFSNLSSLNFENSAKKKINLRHVFVGLISILLFLINNSLILPHLPSLTIFGWSLFFADISLFCFLIFYIWKADLQSIFFVKNKYVKLGIYTYLLYLPWVGVAGVLCHFIVIGLLGANSIETVSNVFHKQIEWNGPIFYALAISASFFSPVSEEIVFRGLFQNFTTKVFGSLTGLLFTSLLFSLVHYKFGYGLTNMETISHTFVFSLFIGYLYQRTGSLISCIGFHMTNNFISYIPLILERLQLFE
jgi:membrane protease YdiL (CAAX protease family)